MPRYLSAATAARLALVPALIAAVAFSACGDDDSKSSSTTAATSASGSSGGGGGSDATYVATICKAQVTFKTSLTKIVADNKSVTDPAKQAALLQPPIDQLIKDVKTANPPADARDYHNKVIAAFEDASAQLKAKKDPSVFDSVSDPGPAPAEVGKRLQAAADKNADCKTADMHFDQ